MEIHATKNPSGVTVSVLTDGMVSCKEFTFRRKGKVVARITVDISGGVFVNRASTVHVNENLIGCLAHFAEGYCDIDFKSFSGQE